MFSSFNLVVVTFLACAVSANIHMANRRKPLPGRIVGGTNALITEFPYQVAIKQYEVDNVNGTWITICGGAIISQKIIVTAAHCVFWRQTNEYRVAAATSYPDYAGIIRNVSKIIIHEHYGGKAITGYDIAVIILTHRLHFSTTIQPIGLASVDLPDGATGVVTGWGQLKDNGAFADILQKVEVPVINQEICEKIYAEKKVEIMDSMLCAGYAGVGGRDACRGDSGGPFVKDYLLYGVTSWGIGCASALYPGVYTRITKVAPWIRDKVEQEGLTIPFQSYKR